MATAKEIAQEQLGTLDTSYLDAARKVASDSASTSKNSLQNTLNNLLSETAANKVTAKTNFNKGRNTVAENAFDTSKTSALDLGSRVAGKSGLNQLEAVGNRMETGIQNSELANTYYGDVDKLNTTEKQAKTQYTLDEQIIDNTLNQALTDIQSQQSAVGNSYNSTLANLAESIQSRIDSNANSQASINQQAAAANQAHADAVNSAKAALTATNKQNIVNIVGDETSSYDQKVQRLVASGLALNEFSAKQLLSTMGINSGVPTVVKPASTTLNSTAGPTSFGNNGVKSTGLDALMKGITG